MTVLTSVWSNYFNDIVINALTLSPGPLILSPRHRRRHRSSRRVCWRHARQAVRTGCTYMIHRMIQRNLVLVEAVRRAHRLWDAPSRSRPTERAVEPVDERIVLVQ